MKKMGMIIGLLFIVIGGFLVYEYSSYSPVVVEFMRKKEKITGSKTGTSFNKETFEEQELRDYPKAIQKYFSVCGYLNKPKMDYAIASYKNVQFLLKENQKPLNIQYERVNDGHLPNVLAFIDTTFYGFPFQGIDSYYNHKGSMKGVLAKHIILFDESGEDFYTGSLVTYLSECLLVPSAALQPFISWKEINEQEAEGQLSYHGYKVGGRFRFNDNGELESFTTNDRVAIDSSGNKKNAPWTARFLNYITENDIRRPQRLQAIWHYESGDSVYFDGEMSVLTHGYKE